jgi:hypothetical protein
MFRELNYSIVNLKLLSSDVLIFENNLESQNNKFKYSLNQSLNILIDNKDLFKNLLNTDNKISQLDIRIYKDEKDYRRIKINLNLYEPIYYIAKLYGCRLVSTKKIDNLERVYNTFILHGPEFIIGYARKHIEMVIGYINMVLDFKLRKRVNQINKENRMKNLDKRIKPLSDLYINDSVNYLSDYTEKIRLIIKEHLSFLFKHLNRLDKYLLENVKLYYNAKVIKKDNIRIYHAKLNVNQFKINRVLLLDKK